MFKKPSPVYRTILKKAWEITRKNKFLWVFGIFAALAGNGGVYEILFKGFGRITSRGETLLYGTDSGWSWSAFTIPYLEDVSLRSPLFVSFLWVLIFMAVIVLGVLICLSVISRGALIDSIKKISGRKKTNLREGWTAGKKYFWPVLGINALAKAMIFGLLVIVTVPAVFFITGGTGGLGWNIALYILAFVIFTSLALIISFMATYASCFIVLENLPFVEAIRASWKMFIKNWLVSLEMALLLFLIVIGAGLVLLLLSVAYLVPVSLLLLAFIYLNLPLGFWLIIVLATLGWLALVCFTGAFLSSYQFSAWTLLFAELNKKRIWSKLLRFVGLTR